MDGPLAPRNSKTYPRLDMPDRRSSTVPYHTSAKEASMDWTWIGSTPRVEMTRRTLFCFSKVRDQLLDLNLYKIHENSSQSFSLIKTFNYRTARGFRGRGTRTQEAQTPAHGSRASWSGQHKKWIRRSSCS